MKSKGTPWATFLEAPGAEQTGSWCRAACTEWRRGTRPHHSLGDVVGLWPGITRTAAQPRA